jgi:hypothetical protein
VANEVIFKLDQQMDHRPLSQDEIVLRKELKGKCLGLTSLSRTIARQRSRVTFLAEGDANNRSFHLQACHRGHKNYIDQLSRAGTILVNEYDKAQTIFEWTWALSVDLPDKFAWKWTSNQQYSSSSAYRAMWSAGC